MGRWIKITPRTKVPKGVPLIVFNPNGQYDGSPRIGEASLCGAGEDEYVSSLSPGEWGWANDSCSCCYGSMTWGKPTHFQHMPKPPKEAPNE